jgi:Integrase core domain
MLDAYGITCSMSRRGDCHDNAVMEAFFSTVKTELADRFESCGAAKMELFDYIEVFYNHRRRHSTIGYVSPAAFERAASNSAVQLEGVLVGTHAPAPTFLAQADERLHAVLSPLTKETDATMNLTDA